GPTFSVNVVAGADRDLFKFVEHVDLRERKGVEAVEHHRSAKDGQVEPAGAPRPSGHGTVLVATFAKALAGGVIQLGREGAAAHPRRVRLRDAEDAVDVLGGDAESGADAADDRVG